MIPDLSACFAYVRDAAQLSHALGRGAARIVVFDAPLPFVVALTLYTALLTLIILIMLISLDVLLSLGDEPKTR